MTKNRLQFATSTFHLYLFPLLSSVRTQIRTAIGIQGRNRRAGIASGFNDMVHEAGIVVAM
jgi:hypothetical protein